MFNSTIFDPKILETRKFNAIAITPSPMVPYRQVAQRDMMSWKISRATIININTVSCDITNDEIPQDQIMRCNKVEARSPTLKNWWVIMVSTCNCNRPRLSPTQIPNGQISLVISGREQDGSARLGHPNRAFKFFAISNTNGWDILLPPTLDLVVVSHDNV
jgi:hypothetical protein